MTSERARGEGESRLTQQTVRGARLTAVCFFVLILKSAVIRMRGTEPDLGQQSLCWDLDDEAT